MADGTTRILEFDIRGQICPSTLLVALREMNCNFAELNSGRLRLIFRSDNRDSINTIPSAAGNMGLHCAVEKDENGYKLLISKQ